MEGRKSIQMTAEEEGIEMTEDYLGFAAAGAGKGNEAQDATRQNRTKSETNKAHEPAEGEEAVGVPIDDVLEHLKYRTHSSQLCFDFILYIPFLVIFILFILSGRDVTENYYVVRVLKDRLMGNALPTEHIDKGFDDIANAYDWGRWATYVMVPNTWDCTRDNQFPQITAQGQNLLLGAMRVRTHRVTNTSCTTNSHLYDGEECYGTWTSGDQQTEDRFNIPNPLHYPNYTLVRTPAPLEYIVDYPVPHPVIKSFNFSFDSVLIDQSDVIILRSFDADPVAPAFYPNGSFTREPQDLVPWGGEGQPFQSLTFYFPSAVEIDGYYLNTDATSNLVDPLEWELYYTTDTTDNATQVSWQLLDTGDLPEKVNKKAVNTLVRQTIPRSNYHTLQLRVIRHRAELIQETPDKPFMYKHKDCDFLSVSAYIIGDISVYHCGGYKVDLPFNASCSTIEDVTKVFQSNNAPFYDVYATRFLSLEFFVYSVQLNTFTAVKLFSEVAACGSWVNKWYIRTFTVYTNEPPVLEFIFLAFVLYFWVRFFLDWRSYYKGYPPGTRENRGKFFQFLFEFWNLLELTNLVTFLVVFGLQFSWMIESRKAEVKIPLPDQYPEQLDFLLNLYITKVLANSVNTVITFLKFLKYVRLNSRLNVLSATISLKSGDMVACLIIFVYVVFAYALTANALFGSGLADYRSISTAYSTLTRMLLGDFDYDGLRKENRFLAGAFFWSFVVIGLFLLLNFLVAILSEGFAQVSGQNTDVPLDEQLTKAWADIKRAIRPERLGRGLKMMLQGNSRHTLLLRATIKLEDYKAILEDSNMAGDGNKALLYRGELPVFIGQEEYDLLGKDFMDDVWGDVLYDYKIKMKNDASQKNLDNQEAVENAVVAATSGRLNDIDHMWHKMQLLQEELNNLSSTLQNAPAPR